MDRAASLVNVPGPCETAAADASAALLKRIDDLEKEVEALKARPPVESHFHGPPPTPPPEPFQYPRYPTWPLSPTVWCNKEIAGLTTVD